MGRSRRAQVIQPAPGPPAPEPEEYRDAAQVRSDDELDALEAGTAASAASDSDDDADETFIWNCQLQCYMCFVHWWAFCTCFLLAGLMVAIAGWECDHDIAISCGWVGALLGGSGRTMVVVGIAISACIGFWGTAVSNPYNETRGGAWRSCWKALVRSARSGELCGVGTLFRRRRRDGAVRPRNFRRRKTNEDIAREREMDRAVAIEMHIARSKGAGDVDYNDPYAKFSAEALRRLEQEHASGGLQPPAPDSTRTTSTASAYWGKAASALGGASDDDLLPSPAGGHRHRHHRKGDGHDDHRHHRKGDGHDDHRHHRKRDGDRASSGHRASSGRRDDGASPGKPKYSGRQRRRGSGGGGEEDRALLGSDSDGGGGEAVYASNRRVPARGGSGAAARDAHSDQDDDDDFGAPAGYTSTRRTTGAPEGGARHHGKASKADGARQPSGTFSDLSDDDGGDRAAYKSTGRGASAAEYKKAKKPKRKKGEVRQVQVDDDYAHLAGVQNTIDAERKRAKGRRRDRRHNQALADELSDDEAKTYVRPFNGIDNHDDGEDDFTLDSIPTLGPDESLP